MPDERIARWAARGSEAAFAVIFERHHQALHRYCHTIVGNGHDASDALQSTMLKAFRALPGETRDIALRPWLYRIAHNESISLLRARRSDSDLQAAAHVSDPAADGVIDSRDRIRTLTADLTELTEQQRGVLLMRELGGLSFAEIAAALQIGAAAAKQTVYESRCVLQTLQEGREMDCDVIRRTLSDGDRRMLRAKRLRGHLRSCAGCRDFQQALHARPAQLAALAPPLPLGAAAAMLQGLLGGGGFGAGGGLIAGMTGGAKGIAGLSLATKVASIAIVGSTIVAGGALVIAPVGSRPATPAVAAPALASAGERAAAPRLSVQHATTPAGEAALRASEAAVAARALTAAITATSNAFDQPASHATPAVGADAAHTSGAHPATPPGRAVSAAARAKGRPAATHAAQHSRRSATAGTGARRHAGKPATPATAGAKLKPRSQAPPNPAAAGANRATTVPPRGGTDRPGQATTPNPAP